MTKKEKNSVDNMTYTERVLLIPKVRKALKKQKIGIRYFRKYGFVNQDNINNTYFVGMGKWNGAYDWKVIEVKIP